MIRYLQLSVLVVSIVLFLSAHAFAVKITSDSASFGDANGAAGGPYSVAFGIGTSASGIGSIAMGKEAYAQADYSTVIGSGSEYWALINNTPHSLMIGYMNEDTSSFTPEFFVKDNGVGINTKSPATMFHVKKEVSGGATVANHVAIIENTSTSTSPDVLMLKVNNDNPTTACNFITFADVDSNLGSIEGNGGGITLNTSGGDFAEYLPKVNPKEFLTPGDIVGLSPEGLSKVTQDAQRLMVVTTAPAVLGNRPDDDAARCYAPVAFIGQVPVKTNGPVKAGDYIIPCGQADGTGMAVSPSHISPSQYGMVVGRSLESNQEDGLKKVNILIGLPQNGLWNGLVKLKESRISELEKRLAVLEAKANSPVHAGFIPGAGVLFGVLCFLWTDRRRKQGL